MIKSARRSIAVACLVVFASLCAAPAAQATPHWALFPCGKTLQAYWMPRELASGIFLTCETTADRNQAINDALVSGDPTRMSNALQALVQQNADSFLTRQSPCTPGQVAAIYTKFAKCVG